MSENKTYMVDFLSLLLEYMSPLAKFLRDFINIFLLVSKGGIETKMNVKKTIKSLVENGTDAISKFSYGTLKKK